MSGRRQAGATSPGAVLRVASGRGEGRPGAPGPRSRPAGPRPLAGCRSVWAWGLGVSAPPGRPAPLPAGHPTFSAATRRALGATSASASSAPGPGSERGARGPRAPGRRARAPPPPPQALSLRRPPRFPPCHSVSLHAASRPPLYSLHPAPVTGPATLGLRVRGRLPAPAGPAQPPPPALAPGGWLPLLWSLPLCSVSLRSLPPPCVSVAFSQRGLSTSPSPCGSPPASALSLPCPPLAVSPAARSSVSLPPTLGAAPSVWDPGPRSPRPRLAREPELPPPAARRELPTRRPPPALRDFRPSSHVTRAPLRRPRVPPARQPRGAGALPCPVSPACTSLQPAPRGARGAGQGPGLGAARPRSGPGSRPGFPPRPRSAPPRTRSGDPLPCFPAPRGRWGGLLGAGRPVGGSGGPGVPGLPAPLFVGRDPSRSACS